MSETQRRIVGGWSAAQNGLEPGKHVEYQVVEFQKPGGASWRMVQFFKPYQSTRPEDRGQWKPGFSFPLEKHAELVERINHMLKTFLGVQGGYVFQAGPPLAQNVPYTGAPQPPQGYGPQPPQQMPLGYGPAPTTGPAPQNYGPPQDAGQQGFPVPGYGPMGGQGRGY